MSTNDWIFLVETSAVRLADGAEFPLYLAKPGTIKFPHACYLGQVAELPRLTRQADSSTDPKRVPVWGSLRLAFTPQSRPDAENSITWSQILSPEFNLLHRPLVIKVGLRGDAYGAFNTIFRGGISEIGPWANGGVTVTLRDKGKDLERVAVDYTFPESPLVIEDAQGNEVNLPLGYCQNVTPQLFATAGLFVPPWFPPLEIPAAQYRNRWALSGGKISQLDKLYYKGGLVDPMVDYVLVQADLSPARKNGEGTAELMAYGPYTGALSAAEWLLVINSITALNSRGESGPEIGLATCRYSLDGGLTWSPVLLTWKLDYDSTTLAKTPTIPPVGNATMAISGEFTGDTKDLYKIKVVYGGGIGAAMPPKFIWSKDNGANWFPVPASSWTPIAAAPGIMTVTASNPYDVVSVEITTGGYVGGAVRFRWSNNGRVTWTENCTIPDTSPIELFSGFSVQFTAPGGAADDYDAGDAGGHVAAIEILDTDPIFIDRGLSAAFVGPVGSGNMQWVPVASALGVMSIASIDPAYDEKLLEVVINAAGSPGPPPNDANFNWRYDSGAWTYNASVPDTAPIELIAGKLSIQFTEVIEPMFDPPIDDYDVGDSWLFVEPFVIDDTWAFTFKEIPIPLADGVSVQFCKGDRVDPAFELDDDFTFILMSTLNAGFALENNDLTCDLEGMVSPLTETYVERPGALIAAIAAAGAGWTGADIDLDAIAAFDLAFPYKMGWLAKNGDTVEDIIKALLQGFPAFYTLRLDEKFYLAELTPPAGDPEITLTDRDLLECESQQLAADLVWRVLLNYGRNWTPTQTALDSATPERQAWLRREWRQVSDRRRAILTAYPWAVDQGPIDTAVVERADALALVGKNLSIFGVRRELHRYEIKDPQLFVFDLGVPAQIRRPCFGLDSGALFRLLGLDIDLAAQAAAEFWR